jgi:hypothetical protein
MQQQQTGGEQQAEVMRVEFLADERPDRFPLR